MKNASKTRYILMVALANIAITGCKKDCVPPQPCTPIPNPASPFGWGAVYSFGYFQQPCFNPNDPNEIVFKQGVYDSEESPRICTFNLTTLEKRTIFTNNTFSPPDWGANGKIIFTRPDYNIWQINPDGSGLEKLTNTGCYFGTCWSPSGSHFRTNGALCNNGTGAQLLTAQGDLVLTFTSGTGSRGKWNNDSLICSAIGTALGILNTIDQDYLSINPPTESLTYGADWLNENEIIWSYNGGILLTDYVTHQTRRIKSSCNAITYQSPTYHPVSNKVVWQKVVKEPMAGASSLLSITSRLVIMNPDGTQEEELEIPY